MNAWKVTHGVNFDSDIISNKTDPFEYDNITNFQRRRLPGKPKRSRDSDDYDYIPPKRQTLELPEYEYFIILGHSGYEPKPPPINVNNIIQETEVKFYWKKGEKSRNCADRTLDARLILNDLMHGVQTGKVEETVRGDKITDTYYFQPLNDDEKDIYGYKAGIYFIQKYQYEKQVRKIVHEITEPVELLTTLLTLVVRYGSEKYGVKNYPIVVHFIGCRVQRKPINTVKKFNYKINKQNILNYYYDNNQYNIIFIALLFVIFIWTVIHCIRKSNQKIDGENSYQALK